MSARAWSRSWSSSWSIGLLLTTLIASAAEAGEIRGEARFALVVGNNAGREPARTLKYAEQEVARLADLLRRTGDFELVDVQQGQSRGEVEAALQSLKKGIERARADGRRTLFFFFYSGHADGEALELGSSRLPLRTLSTYLENLSADIRLAFIDACRSGVITGVKGGRRAPAYEIRIADVASVRGLAIVTSSTASEPSQESDDLRSSYFSHNVMTGLQGLADRSGDGQITLSELYDFAFRRTLASTAANLTGSQHPTYAYRLSGTGEVVLTRAPVGHARLRFPGDPGATYSVLRDGDLLAEVAASGDSDSYLALPAGEYRVVRRALADLTETRLRLAPGGSVRIEPTRMAALLAAGGSSLGRPKGNLQAEVRSAAAISSSSLDLQIAWQTGVGPVKNAVPALQLGYARQLSPRQGLRLRLDSLVPVQRRATAPTWSVWCPGSTSWSRSSAPGRCSCASVPASDWPWSSRPGLKEPPVPSGSSWEARPRWPSTSAPAEGLPWSWRRQPQPSSSSWTDSGWWHRLRGLRWGVLTGSDPGAGGAPVGPVLRQDRIGIDQRGHPFARPSQSASHGRHGEPHRHADGCQVEPLHMAEQIERPVAIAEPTEGLEEMEGHLPRLGIELHGAGSQDGLGKKGRVHAADALALDLLLGSANRYGDQERSQGLQVLQLPDLPEEAKEDLLGEILKVGAVAQDPAQGSLHQRVEAMPGPGSCLPVPRRQRPRQQHLLGPRGCDRFHAFPYASTRDDIGLGNAGL